MSDLTSPYFTLYQDSQGQWRWNLKAKNHKILADSAEAYHNKQDALRGISLVKGTILVWDATAASWL